MNKYSTVKEFIRLTKLNDDVISFLSSLNQNTNCGCYTLKDGNYVNVIEFQTDVLNNNDVEFESHKKYIDVHILLKGNEVIAISDEKNSRVSNKYSAKDDCEGRKGKNTELVFMKPQEVLYIETGIPHAPGFYSSRQDIKKAILKLVQG